MSYQSLNPYHILGLGVPAQPGTGALRQALGGSGGGNNSAESRKSSSYFQQQQHRRKDLGTIPGFRTRSSGGHSIRQQNQYYTNPQTNEGPHPRYSQHMMNTQSLYEDPHYQSTLANSAAAGGPGGPSAANNDSFVGAVASMFFGRKGGYL